MKRYFMTRYVGLLLAALAGTASVAALPNWTLLVFVQANNNLSSFAMQNFNDMATLGSTANLNTVVQWYQPNKPGIWRYKIEQGRMVLDECIGNAEHDGTTGQELVDAMRWAVTRYPAQQYSLVLWNHGIGIVDPVWGKMRPWQVHQPRLGFAQEVIRDNPRIQLAEGIALENSSPLLTDMTNTSTCSLLDYVVSDTRGILFNEQTRRYMDNTSLCNALCTIKTDVLQNKKIDLLGMDACLMAMLEVGYLAKDAAKVLVASQEVELARGWNWLEVVNLLNASGSTPNTVSKGIVSTFEKLYKNRIPFYTQSAINLDGMTPVREALDAFVTCFNRCKSADKGAVQEILRKARRTCQQFSSPNYIDLHSLLSEVQRHLGEHKSATLKRHRSTDELQEAIRLCHERIESYVIACVAGPNLARARGLSVYFPTNRIDDSYSLTTFAKDSQWCSFLRDYLQG